MLKITGVASFRTTTPVRPLHEYGQVIRVSRIFNGHHIPQITARLSLIAQPSNMKHRITRLLPAMAMGLLVMMPGCQRHTTLGLGLDTMKGRNGNLYPSVKLELTILPPIKILSVVHEVFTEDDIGKGLNAGYIELCTFINKHRLPSGKVMAFYYTYDMPYIVEAAMEVDSVPPVLDGSIGNRVIAGGEVLIAHYKGPYEKAGMAYHAMYQWLEEHHKAAREIPFEVYLNDPITIRNKNDLQTDIYQFIK